MAVPRQPPAQPFANPPTAQTAPDRLRNVRAWTACCAIGLLAGCASSHQSVRTRYRDYALALGRPYANEAGVAQDRVNSYLTHLNAARRKALASTEYLAVEATTMAVNDVAGLVKRINSGGEPIATITGDSYDLTSTRASFIMIFDAKTGKPATEEGYVAVDTPQKGQSGMFGGYDALYIGNGR